MRKNLARFVFSPKTDQPTAYKKRPTLGPSGDVLSTKGEASHQCVRVLEEEEPLEPAFLELLRHPFPEEEVVHVAVTVWLGLQREGVRQHQAGRAVSQRRDLIDLRWYRFKRTYQYGNNDDGGSGNFRERACV